MTEIENLKPERVFYYFSKIASIPHGSFHTKEISDYIKGFANELGLECHQDDKDNLVIIKPAYMGYEGSPAVIIQGHIDMVCEKESDCEIDFEKDGLELYVDHGFLRARGTTLGGDDGIAVAYAMAILEDASIPHPRLEVVLTTNEEVGLLGVKEIDLSMLKGNLLLNIDSDLEGHFLTSCAGGITANIRLPIQRQTLDGVIYKIRVYGLFGGHSGGEIHKERGNAILTMGRVLKYAAMDHVFSIITLQGGKKDNAIPRETEAEVLVVREDADSFKSAVTEIAEVLKQELQISDPGIEVSCEMSSEGEANVLNQTSFSKILFLLRNLPNGVMNRSGQDDAFVETSLNSGIMKLEEDEFFLCTSIRSSVSTRKMDVLDRICYLSDFLGAEIETHGDYSAWEYNPQSELRGHVAEVYQSITGEVPVFEGIHAGLECGILASKIPDLDAVSFGPLNLDIHTPQERLDIASAERVYQFLLALLKDLK